MPKLIIALPESGEVTHELSEPAITLGRLPENMVQIEDASVSSRHAELTVAENGNYHLRDLHSTNGTRVNGNGVTEALLRPGDRVLFGKIEAVYQSDIGMPAEGQQPLPAPEGALARPAEQSTKPSDFANAAPFAKKVRKKDPTSRAILVFAIVAFVLFLLAVYVIFTLRAPTELGVSGSGGVMIASGHSPLSPVKTARSSCDRV